MSYIGRQLNNLSDRVKLDSITASATATYNLLLNTVAYVPSSAESLTVSLNGVIQAPQDSYTVSGSQITFASALTSSDSIDFILAERSITLTSVSAGSVGTSQLAADAVNGDKIADDSISDEHLDITAITGQTAITSLADTDKFLVSDASDSGNLKYVEKQYLPSGTLVKVGDVRSNVAASAHNLTGIFSDTYDSYFFSLSTFPITAGQYIYMQFLDSSDTAIATGYYGAAYGLNQSGGEVRHSDNGVSAIKLNDVTSNARAWQAHGYIKGPTSGITNNKTVTWQSRGSNDVNVTYTQTGGYLEVSSTDATGMRIYSGVNLSGISLQVYGIVDTKHYNGT